MSRQATGGQRPVAIPLHLFGVSEVLNSARLPNEAGQPGQKRYISSDDDSIYTSFHIMPARKPSPQPERLLQLLKRRGMVRSAEMQTQGITAATAARLVRDGRIVRLARGLYQLPDAPMEAHHALAEVAKRAPKAVICLLSALAFHDLTDQLPPKVWVALGRKDWTPRVEYPPLRIARFSAKELGRGIETHRIEGVPVRITTVTKTLVDAFRYRRDIGVSVCIESLRQALKTRKATPAEISKQAVESGVWKAMQPYMEALTFNG